MKTGLRWALSAGLALASGLTGIRQAAAATSETNPAITIHVRNFAGVAPQILTEAEQVAAKIYGKAGVETLWTDIVLAENRQANSAVPQAFTLVDVQLDIFPDVMADRLGLPNNVMGLAPGTGSDRGIVYLFNGKVTALFWRMSAAYMKGDMDRHVSLGQVLGHAIAHEVGHLLLNQQVHSPTGIMRGEWGFADFRDMTYGMLLFTSQQAEFLRAEVRSRNSRQEIIKAAALDSPPPER
jgi:hypothetical protein